MANKIKLNHSGMDKMLKSSGVQAGVTEKANEIAHRATMPPTQGQQQPEIIVREKVGRTRAIAWLSLVHPISAYLERKYRVLGRAMMGG